MALVYKRSTERAARSYERSPGMEPNPGVSALTVVNPRRRRTSRRRTSRNPFQWIEGRGQRHVHASPEYKTLDGAARWKGRKGSKAKLYPVDERGTLVSRPVDEKLLRNTRRTGKMAYNIGALRRAMKSNARGVRKNPLTRKQKVALRREMKAKGRTKKQIDAFLKMAERAAIPGRSTIVVETPLVEGVSVRGKGRKGRTSKRTSKRSATRRRKTSRRAPARRTARRKSSRRKSKRTSKRRSSRRKSPARKRRSSKRKSKRASKRRSSRRRSSRPRRRKTARKSTRRRASRRRSSKKRSSRRRRPARSSRRRSSRRRGSRRRATARGQRRRTRRTSRGKRRRSGGYWGRRRVKLTGHPYVDKYLKQGLLPAVTRVRRSSKSKAGRPSILVYPIAPGRGRTSKRKTSRKSRARRSYAVGASHKGRRGRRVAANRRRSRRTSRRRSTRRNSRRTGLYANRRRRSSRRRGSRRGSRRRRGTRRNTRYATANRRRRSRRRRPARSSRRRSSRRRGSRRRLTRNMLAASKVKWGGRGSRRMGRARGRLYQLVEYGSRSKGRPSKGGKRRRLTGYPVLVPAHVSERAYVRKYTFGGAAKDAHRRAKRRGYTEKRYPKRRVKKNRRRTSMRRNPRYVVANRRRRRKSRRNSRRKSRRNSRRRRLRRNFFGANMMRDVVMPVAYGTGGFVGARVLSNGIANIEGLRNILDAGKPAGDAANTKIAANVLGIIATLGLSTRVRMIRNNQGAIITGMGLALTDRLLGKVTGQAAGYLSGMGEYVSTPLGAYYETGMGEYVSTPLGAYVNDPGMGEYVNQPLQGMGETYYAAAGLGYPEGVDPGDGSMVDGMMDTMEATAGVEQATAGLGETYYAAAGLGATMGGGESDAALARMWAQRQIPMESIQTPTDVARRVNQNIPYTRQVPDTPATPEGRGYAGGVFARHLFGGMI